MYYNQIFHYLSAGYRGNGVVDNKRVGNPVPSNIRKCHKKFAVILASTANMTTKRVDPGLGHDIKK